MNYKLLDHQVIGVEYAIDHHYSINGDAMGLGKTLQALEVARRTGLSTLIICPAFLKDTWKMEIAKWDMNINVLDIISYGSLKKAEDLFTKADFVICDECHYLKNIEAKRTQHFHNYMSRYKPDRFLGLSGTPIKNRTTEFYSLLAICDDNPHSTSGVKVMDKYKTFWDFAMHFCNMRQFEVRGRIVTKWEGHRNIEDLKGLLKGKYIRRKASEVLDLPEIVRKDVLLSSKDIDEDLLAAWNGKTKAFMTLKRNSAKVKAKPTAGYVKDLLEQGEGPIIIYSDHVEPVQMMAKEFKKYKVKTITGGTPMDKRSRAVNSFQAGAVDVLVATIGSLSVGVTLTKSRNIVFNDLPWVVGDIAQAEKRIHRIGQTGSCVIHRMFWGKIDHHIGQELTKKIETLVEVL